MSRSLAPSPIATVRDSGSRLGAANRRSAAGLARPVHDGADDPAGQHAVGDLQPVGLRRGRCRARSASGVDHLGEPAGHHARPRSRAASACGTSVRAPGVSRTAARTLSTTDARAARPAARPARAGYCAKSSSPRIAALRHLGDLVRAAGVRGEQLDHLVLDQRGVDVHDDQPAPAAGQPGGRRPRRRPRGPPPPAPARGAASSTSSTPETSNSTVRHRVPRQPADPVDVGAAGGQHAWRSTRRRAGRRGAPISVTCRARPDARRAVALAGDAGDLQAERPAGGGGGGARARSPGCPAETSTPRVSRPRTTTCSTSMTSTPGADSASKTAEVTPGRSAPVTVTSSVRGAGSATRRP